MAVFIVFLFLVVLGVVSLLGWTVDSRDPDHRLARSIRDHEGGAR